MLHPLLSLWRHSCRATFYDQGVGGAPAHGADLAHGLLPPLGTKRWFRSADEAVAYLRYWSGDPSAQSELRWLLKKCAPAPLAGATVDRWMHALAGLLLTGTVVVVEESARRSMPGRLVAAPAASTAAALAALPPLSSVPAVAPPPNVLPAVEEARIESAEVLPELDQSLEQVNATMGQVDSASASVAPAPDKVPDISTAMQEAAQRAQQAIDGA
jgi:hypothetical protein